MWINQRNTANDGLTNLRVKTCGAEQGSTRATRGACRYPDFLGVLNEAGSYFHRDARTASNSRRNKKLLTTDTAVKMPLISRLSATDTARLNNGKIAI